MVKIPWNINSESCRVIDVMCKMHEGAAGVASFQEMHEKASVVASVSVVSHWNAVLALSCRSHSLLLLLCSMLSVCSVHCSLCLHMLAYASVGEQSHAANHSDDRRR